MGCWVSPAGHYGLTAGGMQPFALDGSYVVCNGEIYGFETLKQALPGKGLYVPKRV